MICHGTRRLAWVLIALFALAMSAAAQEKTSPTPEEYIAHSGGEATMVPSGQFALDGVKLYCGTRPTIIDNKLDDYGAAYPGFLIMNVRLLSKVTTPVKLWIYSHECGHQFRGPDEETADCFAVQRGRRQVAISGRRRGDLPVHLAGEGRQHAFLRLAPLRIHAPVLHGRPHPLARRPRLGDPLIPAIVPAPMLVGLRSAPC